MSTVKTFKVETSKIGQLFWKVDRNITYSELLLFLDELCKTKWRFVCGIKKSKVENFQLLNSPEGKELFERLQKLRYQQKDSKEVSFQFIEKVSFRRLLCYTLADLFGYKSVTIKEKTTRFIPCTKFLPCNKGIPDDRHETSGSYILWGGEEVFGCGCDLAPSKYFKFPHSMNYDDTIWTFHVPWVDKIGVTIYE